MLVGNWKMGFESEEEVLGGGVAGQRGDEDIK